MQLLSRQTEVRVIRVCIRVCGVITQQDILQETEEDYASSKPSVYVCNYAKRRQTKHRGSRGYSVGELQLQILIYATISYLCNLVNIYISTRMEKLSLMYLEPLPVLLQLGEIVEASFI